ncbi:MAG: ferritin family protein [Deltaproteobacteria bacterium]|jgi:rubrerythrin
MFTIREIYDLAVQIERNGEAFYRNAATKVSNPVLKGLLEHLADEEANHIETFSRKKEELGPAQNLNGLDEAETVILRGLLGDQTFSLKEVDLSAIKTQEDLIAAAVDFEKDTILFYDMISAFIEDTRTSARIREIVEEENRHIALLEAYDA